VDQEVDQEDHYFPSTFDLVKENFGMSKDDHHFAVQRMILDAVSSLLLLLLLLLILLQLLQWLSHSML
jgi:hypothetical protein